MLRTIGENDVTGRAMRSAFCLRLTLALLFAAFVALTLPAPLYAATPLAVLEKQLQQERKKAADRQKSLDRLTEQERKLHAGLAAAEKRILELEKGIADNQDKLLALGTEDDKARKEYEAILAEQKKTEAAQAEALRLLWELTGKRMAVGNRDLPDWAETDREHTWSNELYAALEGYRKQLDEQEARIVKVMNRRTRISTDMQTRLENVNTEKKRLLQARVEYDKQLAQVRQKRVSAEAELTDILKLVENLDIQVTQMAAGDIKRLKGKLPLPVNGRIRIRYAPRGAAASRGLGFATAEGAEVRAVAAGTIVHNAVLRGFGTVLIVQHGSDYYSLYAFLGNSPLKVGQDVSGRQAIGKTGLYPALKGPGLYFELRFKQKAINPEQWFAQ